MMKKSILLAVLISGSTMADQASVDAIEQASMQLNQTQLIQLAEQTSGYDQALAHYRLAIAQNLNAETSAAESSLDDAMGALEVMTEQNPDNAEAWALLAQVYGYKISFSPMKAVYYGPKSGEALSKAYNLAPNNPRVHLVKAVSEYNSPAMFGGSKKAAVASLDKAIELFVSDSATGTQWGHAEAYVWRGLAKLSLNEDDAAIADFEQAIELEPDYGWPQFLISQNK